MSETQPFSPRLKTKHHFEILDGLRGVAALAVVIFHFMEIIITDINKNFIGHGFMAVDFFFCLSGFVIAYAYDDRVGGMGVKEFFKARLIRLHPLVVFGSVVGLLGYLFDPFAGSAVLQSAGKTALVFLASALLIPLPIMPERYFNLFSFNAPSWSLFWEYVANVVYALVLYKLSRRWLAICTVLAGVALYFVSHRAGNLLGGWSGSTFADGGVRVAYSFLAGMLVYRSQWIIKNRMGFLGLSILLLLAFVMPGKWWSEATIVAVYFPLIVALGAGATVSPVMKKICNFSGRISYPLYMSHYAAMWIFGGYYAAKKPGTTELTLVIIVGALLLLGFAWLVMVCYDEPVRKWLTNKRAQKARAKVDSLAQPAELDAGNP